MDERCEKGLERGGDWEWEGRTWYGCDVIILNAKGMWFDKDIVSQLWIWEGSIVNGRAVTKIEPECRQKVINTIMYIQENFDHIYQAMLERILPILMGWNMQNCVTHEPVTAIRQLHDAREIEVAAGMEAGCITDVSLNCKYQKDDMVFYSLLYRPDCSRYGFDDGFEIVFWKDHVVFFGDGNPHDMIFCFEDYKDTPFYFEINDV